MTAVESITDAQYARALTDRIKVAVEGSWHLITEAYQSRAWSALGYSSWDDYCTREFGSSRLRLPREDRAETVQSLRSAGLSLRAIAAATNEPVMTVQNELARVRTRTPEPSLVAVDRVTGEVLDDSASGEHEAGSAEWFKCDRCGAQMGTAGTSTGSDDDLAADEYYTSEVDYHQSGQCTPVQTTAPDPVETTHSTVERVTGIDGRSYPRTPDRKPPRKPLVDVAKGRGFTLRQAMEAVERIFSDDRYRTNEKQVADALRGHLLYVAETVAAVLDQLP